MKKRQIGRTDISVNEVGYGSMSLSIERERRPSESDAITLLQRMVDELGVDFIDTADAYAHDDTEIGHGERLIARALKGERRQRTVIATKGGFTRPGGNWIPNGRPEHLRTACEASLRALETDRIDLYQFHRPDPNVPIEESLGALVDLQREGKIRHLGVSNFNRKQLESALEVAGIVSVQNPLAFMYFNPNMAGLLKFCEERGITWIAYAPLGGHRNARRLVEFSDWFNEHLPSHAGDLYGTALAWTLQVSGSVIPIPATTRFEHLAGNVRAADITLTDAEMELIPQAMSWGHYYDTAKQEGDYETAARWMERMLEHTPDDPVAWYNLACVRSLGGRKEPALDAWERSVSNGFPDAEHARNDADLEPIRTEPRFQEALERIGRPVAAV